VELAWGFIAYPQHKVLTLLRNDSQQGRGTIDWLLRLFEKYQIPATWAMVGHLFLDSKKARELINPDMPQFKEGWLDWNLYSSICSMSLYLGRDIVLNIQASPVKHEIGLHSFFHIPFSECSREVAESEVKQGIIGVFAGSSFNPKESVQLKDESIISLSSYASRMNIQMLKASDFNEKLRHRGVSKKVSVQRICRTAKDEKEVREVLDAMWEIPSEGIIILEKLGSKNREIYDFEKMLEAN